MSLKRSLGANFFEPSRFLLVRKSAWLDSAKRGLKLRGVPDYDRLFVYVARESGVPALGYWIKERPGGIIRAFVTLMDLFREPSMDALVCRLRPAREQAMAGLAAIAEEEYAERKELERQEDAKQEWLKFIKTRQPELHRAVIQGLVPVAFPKESTLAGDLNRLARAVKGR